MAKIKKTIKVLEWIILLLVFLIIVIYKYVAWDCILICGDWYDGS